jgi:hypothetical protein
MFCRIQERLAATKSNADEASRHVDFVVNVGRRFFGALFVGASVTRRGIALDAIDKLFKIFGAVSLGGTVARGQSKYIFWG